MNTFFIGVSFLPVSEPTPFVFDQPSVRMTLRLIPWKPRFLFKCEERFRFDHQVNPAEALSAGLSWPRGAPE